MASSLVVCGLLLTVVVMLATVSPAFAQCNTTLWEAVAASPVLALMTSAIQTAGLHGMIDKAENVTVLAFTNEALNDFENSIFEYYHLTWGDLSEGDSNRAASILLYHIIPAPLTAAQLHDGQRLPTSLRGYSLTVSKTNATTTAATITGYANNATIVTADVRVCNSIVHVVDRVLLPNATLEAIPIYNIETTPTPDAGGATNLAIGTWTFALSAVLGVALMV